MKLRKDYKLNPIIQQNQGIKAFKFSADLVLNISNSKHT